MTKKERAKLEGIVRRLKHYKGNSEKLLRQLENIEDPKTKATCMGYIDGVNMALEMIEEGFGIK